MAQHHEVSPGRDASSFTLGPSDGLPWVWLGGRVRFLALSEETDGRYTAETSAAKAGGGPAPHVQSREDEGFYIVDGGPIEFVAGDRTVSLGAGGFVSIAAGTAHRFTVKGNVDRLLIFNAPGGFDHFQREVGAPWNRPEPSGDGMDAWAARIDEAAPSYGITMNPDGVLFQRAPDVRVVEGGSAPDIDRDGWAIRTLAAPEHTSGRYAMVHAVASGGAAPLRVGHDAAVTGVYLIAGRLRLTTDAGDSSEMAPSAFTHLAAGDRRTISASAADTSLLVWHAPGVATPLAG